VGADSPTNLLSYQTNRFTVKNQQPVSIQQLFELAIEPAIKKTLPTVIRTESQIKWSTTVYTTDTAFAVITEPANPVTDSELIDTDLINNLDYAPRPISNLKIDVYDLSLFFDNSQLVSLLPADLYYYYTQSLWTRRSPITVYSDPLARSGTEIYLTDIKVVTVSQTQTSISVGFNVQQIWY
jgi:hypothetical protein